MVIATDGDDKDKGVGYGRPWKGEANLDKNITHWPISCIIYTCRSFNLYISFVFFVQAHQHNRDGKDNDKSYRP